MLDFDQYCNCISANDFVFLISTHYVKICTHKSCFDFGCTPYHKMANSYMLLINSIKTTLQLYEPSNNETNLPSLVVAMPVVWKLSLYPLVDFFERHTLLRWATNSHADQLHVRVWRTLPVPVSLTLEKPHTMYLISLKQFIICHLSTLHWNLKSIPI